MHIRSLGDLSLKNITKVSFKTSLIAVAIASMPLAAGAAGLGQIKVLSGLGQPLKAEILIQASAEELDTLQARLASPEGFARANLAYSAAAASILVNVDVTTGKPVLRLSSSRPVNDPFVELLVELDSSSGKVLREYTFLLDPVDFPAETAVEPSPTGSVQAPASAQATAGAGRSLSPLPPAQPPAGADYRVRRGDTLTRIAAAHARSDISLEQMVVALHRANPQAFDGGNMNRLRAGAVLSIPDETAIDVLSQTQAQREIRAQAADFNRYRSQLAATTSPASTQAESAATQAGSGRIVARVDEARPASSGDELRVSRSSGESSGSELSGGDAARLQALEEELAVRNRALEEANARLSQLEASIRDMQKLLELRSAALAQLQQETEGGSDQVAPQAVPGDSESEAKTEVSAAPAEQIVDDLPALPESGTESEQTLSPSVAEDGLTAPVADGSAAPTAPAEPVTAPSESTEIAAAVSEPVQAAATDTEPAVKPKRRARPAPPPPPPAEPSLVDTLLEDPALLAGGGGILALLLGYIGLRMRQRRQQEDHLPASLPVHELPPTADGVYAATGGQSVDTAQSSIMHTDFGQTGLSAIDADEGVDPVAEADVYMAYGRDAQAEEILQDALKADPERKAIYLKLLEIYSQRRDQRQFELLATELFARTTGQGADWAKAAAMGAKLDPDNLLYVEQHGTDEISTEHGSAQLSETAPGTSFESAELSAEGMSASQATQAAGQTSESDHAASLAELDFTASQPFSIEDALEPSKSQMRDTWTVPGELRQFSGGDNGATLADAERTLAVVEELEQGGAVEMPASGLESSGIDFELDLGEEIGESSSSAPAQAEPASAVASAVDLDFDLAVDQPVADEQGMSFDLDFDLAVPTVEAAEQPEVRIEADQQLPDSPAAEALGELADSVEFELPDLELGPVSSAVVDTETAAAQTPLPTDTAVVDLEKTSFDSSILDFDFDIDQAASPAGAGTPALDVTTLDLDLAGFDVGAAGGGSGPVSLEATELGQLPSDFDALDPGTLLGNGSDTEVDTKLELARAYEDMGDHEGARELLQEVLNEGSETQQQAAREVMARLL